MDKFVRPKIEIAGSSSIAENDHAIKGDGAFTVVPTGKDCAQAQTPSGKGPARSPQSGSGKEWPESRGNVRWDRLRRGR